MINTIFSSIKKIKTVQRISKHSFCILTINLTSNSRDRLHATARNTHTRTCSRTATSADANTPVAAPFGTTAQRGREFTGLHDRAHACFFMPRYTRRVAHLSHALFRANQPRRGEYPSRAAAGAAVSRPISRTVRISPPRGICFQTSSI